MEEEEMAYEAVLYEKDDRIATITFNRPEKLNALNNALGEDTLAALKEAEADPEVGCVILTGAGRAFCAGADLSGRPAQPGETPPPRPLPGTRSTRETTPEYIWKMQKPVIAAINGPAVGWGATVTLLCDIRIASDTARIGFVFVKRGWSPELGSTFLLPRLVGVGKAKELFLTGRIIDAKEAGELGLVNYVVPAEELISFTRKMAREIAYGPPAAISFIKRGVNMGLDSTLASVLEFESFAFPVTTGSEDGHEGVKSFLEKRDPQFKGR